MSVDSLYMREKNETQASIHNKGKPERAQTSSNTFPKSSPGSLSL